MYRGVLPVRARVRGPVRSRIHFFWEFPVRGCVPAIFCSRARAARRVFPATDAAGGASSGPCKRVKPCLTGCWILEVAPYGYNLYPIPHESTAFPHATGSDPVAVCDRARSRPHLIVERNGQYRPAVRDRTAGVGQRRREWRESDRRGAT